MVRYAIRLLILSSTAVLALYVHRNYVRRLKENANHSVKQKLILQVSHSFISVGENNLDGKLRETLECVGRFIRCDRAYVILFDPEEHSLLPGMDCGGRRQRIGTTREFSRGNDFLVSAAV